MVEFVVFFIQSIFFSSQKSKFIFKNFPCFKNFGLTKIEYFKNNIVVRK